MQRDKITPSGKVSLNTSWAMRSNLQTVITDWLDATESVWLKLKLQTVEEVNQMLHYTTLNEFTKRTNFRLLENKPSNILFRPAEAVAVLWLLRHHDNNIVLLTLKSKLHKLLVG